MHDRLNRMRERVRRYLEERRFDEYRDKQVEVLMWSPKRFEAWLRTQLKPEFRDEPIKLEERGRQTDAFCCGLLLAYRSGAFVWLYRGNQCSIHAADKTEMEIYRRPNPEYFVYPEF